MKALLGAGKKGVVCLIASTAGLGGNYIASKMDLLGEVVTLSNRFGRSLLCE